MIYFVLLLYCILLYLRPADWVPGIVGWPFEMIVLCLGLAMAGARYLSMPPEERVLGKTPIRLLLVLWVLVVFLSNAVHGKFGAGVDFAIKFGKIGLIFLLFCAALTSVGKIRVLFVLMVALTVVLVFQGIYQKQHGFGWAGQPLYWGDRICWVGLWDGANVLSLLFVTAFPFILEMIFGPWPFMIKPFAVAAAGATLVGLQLAGSRGAWLALFIVFMVYFKKRVGKLGLILGVTAIAGLLLLAPSRLTNGDDRDRSSTSGRIDMWAEGLDMIRYAPVLGIGKGQFQNYTQALIGHNSFVQNMGETGVIGLYVWVGMIYLSFKSLSLVLSQAEEVSASLQSISRALFVSLTGYLSASMFISTDFELLYILFALCSAVLFIARRETGKELPLQLDRRALSHVSMLVFGGILTIYLITAGMSG